MLNAPLIGCTPVGGALTFRSTDGMDDDRDWSGSDYSRLYHSILSDPKFATVYPDDRAWALYTRLLMAADAAWPTRVSLPRSAGRYAVRLLVEAGVIALTGDLVTIPALSKERAHRYGKGKGRVRYPSDKPPAPGPSRSEVGAESESDRSDPEPHAGAGTSPSPYTSFSDSGKEDRARDDDEPEWPVLSYLASVGAAVDPNGNGIHRKVVDLVRRRGAPAVLAALEESHRNDPKASGRQLVFGAENSLDRPLAKASGSSSGGHTRTAKEVEDAFNR